MSFRVSLCLAATLAYVASCAAPRTVSNESTSAAANKAAASAEPVHSEVPGCPPLGTGDPRIAFGAEAMVPLCRDVEVEPGLTREESARIVGAYEAARADVARGIGPLESPPPMVVLCKTEACAEYFVGPFKRSWTLAPGARLPGAKYSAGSRFTILIVRSDDRARGVLAHETLHVEMAFRLRQAHLPFWFHEGLAAVVADEPHCSGAEGRGIDDLRRLDQNAAWADYTNTEGTIGPTYCQARAEVDAWLHRFGKEKLLDLIAKVRDGAAFQDIYGPMLTQSSGALPTVLVSSAPSLGDGKKPFSLVMWIRPLAETGVLAHVSRTPVGSGFCSPFLGYDAQKRIVSQIFYGDDPELRSFAVAVDLNPRPLGRWTHVAMTWAEGSANRLYVGGTLVAETKAPRYHAPGAGSPMYVAWGSSNVGGATCWHGAISEGVFQGAMVGMSIYDTELSAADVAALARTPP